MKKILFIIILVLGIAFLFLPIFKRSTPKCICFVAGPCPSCDNESLWDKIKK